MDLSPSITSAAISLSATTLLVLLEECNPDASNIVAAYQRNARFPRTSRMDAKKEICAASDGCRASRIANAAGSDTNPWPPQQQQS